ncbi:MgtC/SapB family protein [Deinococcus radiopugnans]|uniref:Mg2+ transporter-C (MgtC) family protein n=1 Tax=Deinococcus radiopugnans ATCC 19172 TaxID=585398 RepID=A0A5C4Y596_9DEIO|nr:MgtC/SapB family protein [Deinococcus radiopugnans]MBB6017040.1 putative Mg2+ transporter-C (MgtC) family protein [Deinococcus radiopugnans ATCC 19172]TNM70723.1 MgtC/SapB family protein [Deinococcus radiopugnans ATCC 19172]
MDSFWNELKLMQGPLVAFVLSGMIGWERERMHRSAGLRTHMLVGMSAALFVVLAESLIVSFGTDDNGVRFDMIGLLGAVVSGISFLGAGAIFSDRGQKAKGLTTAAGLLATAGVGVACGLHLYVLATGSTLLFLFTLAVVRRLAQGEADSAAEEQE